MAKKHWSRRRPSRAELLGFGGGVALVAGAALGVAVATSGGDAQTATPPRATVFVPANPAPAVDGLTRIVRSNVPPGGLVVGRMRILPTGSVPSGTGRVASAGDFKDRARADETPWRWEPQSGEVAPAGLLIVPSSKDWSVRREGALLAVASGGAARVVEEGATISFRDALHDWRLVSGAILDGATFEDVLNERDSANFTYTSGGVVATVIDGSPTGGQDRVWDVKFVLGKRWISLSAPVVPFEDVANFIDALMGANK